MWEIGHSLVTSKCEITVQNSHISDKWFSILVVLWSKSRQQWHENMIFNHLRVGLGLIELRGKYYIVCWISRWYIKVMPQVHHNTSLCSCPNDFLIMCSSSRTITGIQEILHHLSYIFQNDIAGLKVFFRKNVALCLQLFIGVYHIWANKSQIFFIM